MKRKKNLRASVRINEQDKARLKKAGHSVQSALDLAISLILKERQAVMMEGL